MEDKLLQTFNDAHLNDWLGAVTVFVVTLLALMAIRRQAIRRIGNLAKRTATRWDDLLVDLLRATRLLALLAVAIWAAARLVDLPPRLEVFLDRALIVVVLLQIGLWGNRGVRFWMHQRFANGAGEEGSRAMTRGLLTFITTLVMWVLILLVMLDNLGFDVTALVASLGIGGVAVALAVQNILGDLFASLSINLDKPFVIGDFVVVDDLSGTVEHVGLKTTRIRSLSGEQLVFSNADLLKSRIRNYKRMHERRIVFAIGVTYDTPPDTLAAIPAMLQEAVESQDKVRFDRAHFKAFGAFSLDFEVVYFVQDPDYRLYMDVQQAINLAIARRFDAQGIQFAFPTQTLHVAGLERFWTAKAQAVAPPAIGG